MTFSLIVEIALSVLLAATLVYCAILERRLAMLRKGQDGLKQTFVELNTAIVSAGASMRAFQEWTHRRAAGALDDRLSRARGMADELSVLVASGERLRRAHREPEKQCSGCRPFQNHKTRRPRQQAGRIEAGDIEARSIEERALNAKSILKHLRLLPAIMALGGTLFVVKAAGLVREAQAQAVGSATTQTVAAVQPGPVPKSTPDADDAESSSSEVDVLTSLSKRRAELDVRSRDLNTQQELIVASSARREACGRQDRNPENASGPDSKSARATGHGAAETDRLPRQDLCFDEAARRVPHFQQP